MRRDRPIRRPSRAAAPVFLLAVLLAGAGCESLGEVDNPLVFRVVALVEGPDGVERVDVTDGRLACLQFEDTDPAEEVTDQRCVGGYELSSPGAGLELRFQGGALPLVPGTLPLGAGDVSLRFKRGPASGTVTLSRVVRRTTYGSDWYLDIAGTFDIEMADWTVRHGLFYSER